MHRPDSGLKRLATLWLIRRRARGRPRYNPAPFAGNLFSSQRLNAPNSDDRTWMSARIARTIARHARAMFWLCCAALVVSLCVADTQAIAAETTMRLRIAWGGGVERIWHGTIRLSEGRFSELAALGIEANEPGSISLSADGIEIREPSVRAYDGVDVLVTADLEARLTVALADETGNVEKTVEVPLAELVHHSHNSVLDDSENRVLVARSPGDRLRVVCHRDHLVFAPGESFTFELAAHLIEGLSAGFRYSATITANPGGQRVWTEDYESGAEGTTTTATIRVPEFEGVYDLTVAAVPTRLRDRLYSKRVLAERRVQFVVLDPRPAEESQRRAALAHRRNQSDAAAMVGAAGQHSVGAGSAQGPVGQRRECAVGAPDLGTDGSAWPRRNGAEHRLGSVSAAHQQARLRSCAGNRIPQRRAASDGYQHHRAECGGRGDAHRARLGRIRFGRGGRGSAPAFATPGDLLAAHQDAAVVGDQSPPGRASGLWKDRGLQRGALAVFAPAAGAE